MRIGMEIKIQVSIHNSFCIPGFMSTNYGIQQAITINKDRKQEWKPTKLQCQLECEKDLLMRQRRKIKLRTQCAEILATMSTSLERNPVWKSSYSPLQPLKKDNDYPPWNKDKKRMLQGRTLSDLQTCYNMFLWGHGWRS